MWNWWKDWRERQVLSVRRWCWKMERSWWNLRWVLWSPTFGACIDVLLFWQFCYRPTTADGNPLICKLEDHLYLASGHGPWVRFFRCVYLLLIFTYPTCCSSGNYSSARQVSNIFHFISIVLTIDLLFVGTGKVIAELMFSGKATSADISRLGVNRFRKSKLWATWMLWINMSGLIVLP